MPNDARAGVQAKVEIDGTQLSADLQPLLELVVVDEHVHRPDMFMLSFRDINRDIAKKVSAQIGSKVKISGPSPSGGGSEVLIDGEITALEAEYDASGSRAIVRGYDGSHRLHRGRVTQTYQNVKDSDIAQTVAQRAGLQPGKIQDSGGAHPFVSQVNESDWKFLSARAAEIGFEVSVTEGKLNFSKPEKSDDAPGSGNNDSMNPLQLVWNQDLLEFRPRVSASEQVSNFTVRGWDPANKQAVIGSASAGTTSIDLPATPPALAGKFQGPDTYSEVEIPLSTQREVDATAKAIAEQVGSAVAEAEGVARGNPKLKAGTPVSVSSVAADFVGKYTLTHTRHVFDAHAGAGYVTRFEVEGRQDRSLLGITSNGANASAFGPIHGVVVALVTNNDDPSKLARVKLKFPWLSDTYESDWARMTQFGAGPDSGAVFMPEVNDEVLVAFEFGDVRRPIVVGALYNGKDKPRLGDGLFDNGKVKRRGVVSRKGHRFVLFDDPGKSGIALITSDSAIKVSLNETKQEIHVVCKGKVRIEAQDDVSIKSDKKVSIEGDQLEMTGKSGVKVSSSSAVEVSGKPIKLN